VTTDVPVDERGIPTEMNPQGSASLHAPAKPCQLCTGTALDGTPSWQWCQEMDVCGATIDWEKVYGREY
jgi:hypothetical protein